MASSLNPSEHQEQSAVIDWWAVQAPAWQLDVRLLAAICNGAWLAGDARTRAIQMHKLKKAGLRVGYPDLFLSLARNQAHGLYVEMKAIAGRLSAEQADIHKVMRSCGYQVEVCYGAGEAMRAITNYVKSNTQ